MNCIYQIHSTDKPHQVLSPTDPSLPTKIAKHTTAYPKQSTFLLDTATSLGGKPRPEIEITGKEFMPVGHISLNTEYEEPGFVEPEEGYVLCFSSSSSFPLSVFFPSPNPAQLPTKTLKTTKLMGKIDSIS